MGPAVSLPALHHVAVVVRDIEEALPFYRERLGLRVLRTLDVPDQQVRIAFLPLANAMLELVQPLDDRSGVARYLEAQGRSALHHLCLTVGDLRQELQRLSGEGVALIDHEPRPGAEGAVAFIHPTASGGILVELIASDSAAEA
jgi:methylmalonyl-CoA mutase C-terminal domain/subunit